MWQLNTWLGVAPREAGREQKYCFRQEFRNRGADSAGKAVSRTLWIFACKSCRIVFTHTETSAVRDTAEPTPNGKAHFPRGGKDLQCPHCKTESTYRLSDLKYHFQLD